MGIAKFLKVCTLKIHLGQCQVQMTTERTAVNTFPPWKILPLSFYMHL